MILVAAELILLVALQAITFLAEEPQIRSTLEAAAEGVPDPQSRLPDTQNMAVVAAEPQLLMPLQKLAVALFMGALVAALVVDTIVVSIDSEEKAG